MKEFKDMLATLENILRKKNSSLLARLKTGVGSLKDFEHISFLTEESKILYQWKNGTNRDLNSRPSDLLLFDMGIFIDLKKSMEYYSRAAGKLEGWTVSMFPLFESGAGDFYLIECDSASGDYGSIYFHTITSDSGQTSIMAYDSLPALISTIIQCYEKNIYTVSESGFWNSDSDKEYALTRELNPKSKEFWI